MKQICALLSFILAITLSLAGQVPGSDPAREENRQAAAETGGSSMPAGFFNTTAGFLIGTYKSPDSRFGEVYGDKTSLQFGLNLSRILLDIKSFQIDLSLEARLLRRTGKATLSGEATKITMIPLTLAGRLQFRTKYVIPFIGAGIDWYNYKEESVLADTSGWARGYDLQAGVLIVVPGADSLRVKLYFKHTDVTATENEIDVKLGGPEIGVGLSYGFNFLKKAAVIIR